MVVLFTFSDSSFRIVGRLEYKYDLKIEYAKKQLNIIEQ